jgi:hypothetical protein
MKKPSQATTQAKSQVKTPAPPPKPDTSKPIELIVTVLLLLTVVLVYVPLNPLMPWVTLDASWSFGLNQADAQHLVVGKDIIFTFGPYASVYTKAYHPGTNYLMLLGGVVLAGFAATVVHRLTKTKPIVWKLFLVYLFAAVIYAPDVQLFIYPILVAFYVYTTATNKTNNIAYTPRQELFTASLFFPFGLLLLIKGSLLMVVTGIMLLSAAFYWYRGYKRTAVGVLTAPLLAMIIFQLIAGQPLSGLWPYFTNMFPVISGYNEAMSVPGAAKEPVLFVLAAIAILVFCYRIKNTPLIHRLFLMLTLALFLFTAFKAGFTRHDAHALTATASLLSMAYFLYLVLPNKTFYILFGAAALVWLVVGSAYTEQGAFDTLKMPVYAESAEGLALRLSGGLKEKYEDKINEIKSQPVKIPALKGTSDLYSYEQGYLLASNNTWSPRPVLQSYSAYTPSLARLNEAHLTSDKAPNNIIFKVATIDRRLPALDDGLSWPTIINNYQPDTINGGFLYLKQKRAKNLEPAKQEVAALNCTIGDEIMMPNSKDVLFAEFDIHASLLGGLAASLYKPDMMGIVVTLVTGKTMEFRFIPKMGKAGFILSPLVYNTEQFAQLFGHTDMLNSDFVKSFRIVTPGMEDKGLFDTWKPEYTVHLYKMVYN